MTLKLMFKTHTVLAALWLASLPAISSAHFELTIIHTNDFHSRLEPISKYDSFCSEEDNLQGKCFGGSARLATAIANARKTSANSLLLDGGDQFQGTLFYNYYKGIAAAEMMNHLGYDAMTVGNHEFDDGPKVLASFIDAVNFPVLMSNADVTLEPTLHNKLVTSTVVEKGGETIGLIGITPENTDELSSPGKQITFEKPVIAVQREVDKLQARGINKIVVLSHSGYAIDKIVAANTNGVDIIVGGHSNSLLSNVHPNTDGPYPTMVNGTAIVQAYAYGKYLGLLHTVFDQDGTLISAHGEPRLIDQSIAEDQPIRARVKALAEPLESIRNTEVAYSASFINGSREACRSGECAMGNLIADAMLDRVRGQGVSVAIFNAGGIRASLQPGAVTRGDILRVLPFNNTLSTFQIDGNTLIAALENGLSRVEQQEGRFPQIAGMQFSYDLTKASGSRISAVNIEHDGKLVSINPGTLYGVVSNNYVRNGGDGYSMFENAENVYDFGPDIADVVTEYLLQQRPGKSNTYLRIIKR
ncbi:MAG: 5'-nucleotidase/UDP-sugar diphosphatase [Parasphingorhabdus sp.]|jgi:5'-nucleotidase/UDP-sugar diphosphatase